MANKSFRLWQKNGEPINIEAKRLEFSRASDGLEVKLYGAGKVKTVKGVVALTEILPPIIMERK